MKQFWLIRHGQSASNAGAVTKDAGSTPLTERGRREAEFMAKAFTKSPSLIVTSPYIRTQQTAEPTRARFPHTRHEEWLVQEFNSLSPKMYDGTTAKERRPGIINYWRKGDPYYKDDGDGESFVEVLGRIETMFKQLRDTDSEFTAIFAHGIFNTLTMWYWLNQESLEQSAQRMKRVPYFRLGFDTLNCSYIKGEVATNGQITLSHLQTNHLPPETQKIRRSSKLASLLVKRAIKKRAK